MKLEDISYLTDVPKLWAQALDDALTLPDLVETTQRWRCICDDAFAVVQGMTTHRDFEQWRLALLLERSKKFVGEENASRFGALLLPAIIVEVSLVAGRFKVPWGLAFMRLRDERYIREVDGIAHWVEQR